MDKKTVIYQLSSAVTNNNKELFTKTIYDLNTEVIISLTEEEFSQIINISKKVDLENENELFDFLKNKGNMSFKYALKKVDELDNSFLGKFYYTLFISLSGNNSQKIKYILIKNAIFCRKLAEMGINSKENLETSIYFCNIAKEISPDTSKYYAHALMNEGNAKIRLAELGFDRKTNLETAISLYGIAKGIFSNTSKSYARALMNEGNAKLRLAEIGIDSKTNLETAVALCCTAKGIFSNTSISYARALMNEGNARLLLSGMGVDSKINLGTAISLYGTAKQIFPNTSIDYASVLMNEGIAKLKLAEMGIDSKINLETAISLYGTAKGIFSNTSTSYARASMNEGLARLRLAEIGVDSKKNLAIAISLYDGSKERLSNTSLTYARASMNEGLARQGLAELDVDRKSNLGIAISLYGTAKQIFPNTSIDYALALMNEGNAKLKLAEMGVDSKINLETAINLYGTAKQIFPNTGTDYARVLMNEGNARQILAEIGIERESNIKISKDLYLQSILLLEKLEDGWTYSLALLNLNNLLKSDFYKTGDKKYLEEWEKNLGSIEDRIEARNIRYKKDIMARIHEMRANFLEFEGILGVYKASLEYDKAYELSKDPIYKFMCEFCQARIKIRFYCELVLSWKEVGKEGIFLDYYDFTIFECHLENAVNQLIDEEKELKLAVEKLIEIRNRTQIKMIKDRVSAHIYLLQALVDCFNEDSCGEAAENVKKANMIFTEHGDKQGQQMCEMFYNAIIKKRDPNAWQEIILNREFNTNFYKLLCQYSDRKRVDVEFQKYGKIPELVSTVNKELDEIKDISKFNKDKFNKIQNTLDQLKSGFDEIKNQVEEGFKGTDIQLKQIKGEIDEVKLNLEYLVKISNNVDGEERESIRKFTLLIIKCIEKRDIESLKRFGEKIARNSSSIEEIIESEEKISLEEKQRIKFSLPTLKELPKILTEKVTSLSKEVTKEVVVNSIADTIIKSLIPVMATAIFGVPIPSQILTMLLASINSS